MEKCRLSNLMGSEQYKYYAFISYNQKDYKGAKDLFHKLEHYKMSSSLCKKHGWNRRKPMSPLFFAPYEIQPDDLSEELKKRLRESKYLIVVCSPNSAHSKWVGLEIDYFSRELGRKDRVYFFVIDGEPNSTDPSKECYNDAIFELGLQDRLGVNIHEKVYRWPWLNRERAYVQLVTKLLNIDFDTVWQRHKRRLIINCICYIATLLVFVAAVSLTWYYSRSFDMKVALNETTPHNSALFEGEGKLVLKVDGMETMELPVDSVSQVVTFRDISGKYRNCNARLEFEMYGFEPVCLEGKLADNVSLDICRKEDVYGVIEGTVYTKESIDPISGVRIKLPGNETTTDRDGRFRFKVPLPAQLTSYPVEIVYKGIVIYDTICPDLGQNEIFL